MDNDITPEAALAALLSDVRGLIAKYKPIAEVFCGTDMDLVGDMVRRLEEAERVATGESQPSEGLVERIRGARSKHPEQDTALD